MSPKWLISTDLDGTLLHPDGRPSLRACRAFQKLHSMGHSLTLASGRHWDNMTDVVKQLQIPCYLIGSNGAWIGDPSGQVFIQHTLNPALATKVEAALSGTKTAVIVTTSNDKVLLDSGDSSHMTRHSWPRVSVKTVLGADIFKITVTIGDESMERIGELLQASVGDLGNVVRSDPWTIDINARDVSKGRAIEQLAALVGVPMDRTIAFGNEMNDASILRTVAIGVAVEDANPDLFTYASERAKPSSEDGVAIWLEDFFDLEGHKNR